MGWALGQEETFQELEAFGVAVFEGWGEDKSGVVDTKQIVEWF